MGDYAKPPDLIRQIRQLQAQVAQLSRNRPFPLSDGAPTHTADDGSIVIDATNHKIYARIDGSWVAVS